MIQYINLKTINRNTNEQRNVTIAWNKEEAYLLGNLEHNTILIIDQQLVQELQFLVNQQEKEIK
jgi:hypothetical protein